MKKYFPVLEYFNIPNVITSVGMCFGLAACLYVFRGNLQGVFVCLAVAAFMDLVDGFFAVKLNQQTLFGKHADSLVDFFICCIIPSLTAFVFIGTDIFIICAVFFYCICGLWRLANYNLITTEKQEEIKPYFTGLPVPGAMLFVNMVIFSIIHYGLPEWFSPIMFILTGIIMISALKLKKYGVGQKIIWAVALLFLIVIIVT